MQILFKATIVTIATLTLSSCDPYTCGTAYIKNKSSKTVYLVVDSNNVDTLYVGEMKTIAPQCGLVQGVSPSRMVSYTSVRKDDTICRKDIRQDSNWLSTHLKKYEWEHQFVINDSDF